MEAESLPSVWKTTDIVHESNLVTKKELALTSNVLTYLARVGEFCGEEEAADLLHKAWQLVFQFSIRGFRRGGDDGE